jgi:hypothetical protein
MTSERRRSPRIRIVDTLPGRTAGETPVRVRDFSLGGMAVELAVELPVGSLHDFQLQLGDGSVVDLRGRVVRCRALAAPGEPPLFSCGIQFVDDEASDESRAGQVIGRLKGE